MADTASISKALIELGFPKPSNAYLSSLFTNNRVTPPLAAQIATAKLRISKLDLTTPGLFDQASTTSYLPPNITNPRVEETKIAGPVMLQVLGVEDTSRSRWEQIEAMEAAERGETTKGREIIRDIPQESNDDGTPSTAAAQGGAGRPKARGMQKLMLEDWKGERIYGIEVGEVPKTDVGMMIGTKIVLKNATVARGMILLDPRCCTVVGGDVAELHEIWKRDRKKMLQDAIGRGE